FVVGQRPYTVLSGSMEPAIGTGDIVVVERISPPDARVGDVVTFSDPEDSGRLITHRVRSSRRRGARIDFVTKGDANNAAERWRVQADGVISRVRYRVPEVGRLALVMRRRGGLALFVLVPLLLLGTHEIARIWVPQKEATGDASA
ncbi:MAG: signal peptidase I, partial [Actinomycetota bacterium]|nr:signal peptidase I [Actinomycetota bacterium]